MLLEATAAALVRIAALAEQSGDSMLQRFATFLAGLSLALAKTWLGANTFDRILTDTPRQATELDDRAGNWLQRAIAHHEPSVSGSSRDLLHRVLYQGLVDIRAHAYNTGLTDVFNLADVFHNVPVGIVSAMEDVDRDRHLADIVTDTRVRAQRRNCERWLAQTAPALFGDSLAAGAADPDALATTLPPTSTASSIPRP